MAGASGELGQGVELANVQPLLVSSALLLKRPVQLIQIVLQTLNDRSIAELSIFRGYPEQIAQEGKMNWGVMSDE